MAGNDDLIARLRETQDDWPAALVVLEIEAAAEIERLRTTLTDRDAQIERLTRERKDFARTISEWAKKAGEAEGRLEASEWPGVVEGWKARATAAERSRDEARAEVATANANLRKVFMEGGCTLFLDGRNEHGSHVIMSYPANMPESAQDDINEYAEEILAEAEKLGFVVGDDHVWAEWRWQEAQIGDEDRVELRGYWEFVRIDEELTRAALTAKGGENAEG